MQSIITRGHLGEELRSLLVKAREDETGMLIVRRVRTTEFLVARTCFALGGSWVAPSRGMAFCITNTASGICIVWKECAAERNRDTTLESAQLLISFSI